MGKDNFISEDAKILAAYSSLPEEIMKAALTIRDRIFALAQQHAEIGQVEETLKWGMPSYLTKSPKSGTPIRLGCNADANTLGIYVHCQTQVVDNFRETTPADLLVESKITTEKSRAIHLPAKTPLPNSVIDKFLYEALTYHTRRK
jgi:Domain of unknown function (DU1801)